MQDGPKQVTNHALGHFMRAYLEGEGGLSSYIRQVLRERYRAGGYMNVGYIERRIRRDNERLVMAERLLVFLHLLARPCADEQQSREREGILLYEAVLEDGRAFLARIDLERRLVIGFYSKATFQRAEARRRTREIASVPVMRR